MSRIAPIERPWPAEFEQVIARIMPAGMEPLKFLRVLATSPRAWAKFFAGALLDDQSPLSLRTREIVINRTTARCGCDYEWGVHVRLFAERAGLTPEQVADTVSDEPDPALWSGEDRVVMEIVDALIDRKRLDSKEFQRLRLHHSDDQILEIIQLIAFYHGVSLMCGALELEPEPGMPTLPEKGV